MCSHVDSVSDCISTGCDGLVPVVRDIMWRLQSNTFYWQMRREIYIKHLHEEKIDNNQAHGVYNGNRDALYKKVEEFISVPVLTLID